MNKASYRIDGQITVFRSQFHTAAKKLINLLEISFYAGLCTMDGQTDKGSYGGELIGHKIKYVVYLK